MPKYFDFKVCGYYLYFTNKCIIECMHVHAVIKDFQKRVQQSLL